MFDFVIKDAIPDPESAFGIFYKKPESIMILPGLKPVFVKFIESIKRLNKKDNSGKSQLGKSKTQKPIFKAKTILPSEHVLPLPSISDINKQMSDRMTKQSFKKPFSINSTDSQSKFYFICGLCKWTGIILIKSDGKILLSNVQRHYKSQCEKKKSRSTSKLMLLTGYLETNSNIARFNHSMDEEGVHFKTHNDAPSTSNDSESKTQSTCNADAKKIESKNLFLPVGTHISIGTSGH